MKKTISLSFSLLPVLSVFVFYAGFLFAQPKSDGVALPAGASASWWETVQKNIRESEYHIRPKGDGMFSSPNRAQNLRFTYFERGFSATRRDSLAHLWKAELRYIGISKGRAVQRDGARFQLSADANALMATSEGLLMRYRNDEKGMRQDFIVKKKPVGKKPLRLWLDARISGGKVEVKPDAVSFLSEGGAEAMRYSDLKVWDANQRRLVARFEGKGDWIAIVVDDEGAVYPITIDPLSATPNWTAEGNKDNVRFGFSVASAGDVNGDGFSDVIVGAPIFDNPDASEGAAFVYHGSASGLSTTPNWTAESDQTGALFGISVASAGDVNGDGFSDVIVGADFYDNPDFNEGAAFVWHGSSSGVNGGINGNPSNAAWFAEGNQVGAQFGSLVASAGDVNGDGYSDVIVGAYAFDNPDLDEGAAFVWHGSSSGVNGGTNGNPTNAAWSAESNQGFEYFGYSVASAGDVNGDGFSDVIVGSPYRDSGETDEGVAFVWHGSSSGVNGGTNGNPTNAAWSAQSNQDYAYLSYSVATAGDVNGDGYSDVIVGASGFDNGETNEGRAFVYHGSASGLSTTPNWTAESNQASAEFGASVASAGDVNGDGYSDVIVGARYFDNGETNEGRAFVYHGSASGLSATANWTAESNQASAEFGASVGSAGDVNGDGFSDVIVGAPFFDNDETDEGRAFVYHGSASGLSATANWTAESNQAGAEFGYSVASAGDVNGDGYSDVIVGARYFDNGQTDEGRAFVYHGSASGLSATPNWTAESNQAGAGFGWSVGSAGDVNGDGYSDVIVGAYFFDNGELNEGRAFVYHGSASGLSATANWTAESNQAHAGFGISVASAGDVNGDGYSDVIVGARLFDNGEDNEGRAFVYHGSASGLSTTPNWTAESNQGSGGFGAEFGYSVGSAGDVNGDGFSDVIVGARWFDNGQSNEGRAFVYHGSASGLSATPNWTAESNQAGAEFGWSVGSAGDVNGDGYSDVIVGARFFDNGESNEGRAFVYHGSASGLSLTANWTAESNQASAEFGYSVGSAGDVNGDGFSDVIVGARFFDNGESNEGRAFVYHGSASGLSLTANWTAESNQASAEFGASVASAGDVNGDGYSDVIVGARFFDNGESDEGRAFVYYGNAGGGFRQDLRQFRPSTTTPIVPALKTQSLAGVTLRKRQKSIVGRGITKIQVEVKPLGTPFNALGLTQSSFALHAPTGTPTDLTVGGLSNRTMYKWRVRQVERPSSLGHIFLPRSRWHYPAGVAPTESHFQVSDDDLPLPVNLLFFRAASTPSGVRLSWQTASEVENAGFIIMRDGAEIASYRTHPALRGQGTTTQLTDYQFLDENVSLNETYAYTLYDVSYSGAMNAHPPITLTFTAGNGARGYALAQNYPNPFNPMTTIEYELPVRSEVRLKVYDALGREVATLVNERQEAGRYEAQFNASGLASGTYFYRLQAGGFTQTRKMMLVK